ncbi:MAG: iron-containing alcohol dehydrogenase [Thermodesulfobacteriota bacterium]|nr:iron-containing alcohol dehydrogenase [Thermodesulfobacteriota bacterium]
MRFEFATATRIIFGPNTIEEVAPIAAEMGHRAFVIAGRTLERATGFLEQLKKHGIECVTFNVPGEPTTTLALKGVQLARQAECDLVIGIGGGSVIDTGKVIAALLTNSGELLDYLEVIGRGQKLSQAPAPYIAIPTTSGTGAEVTLNAVLGSPEHCVKVSMRSPLMLPCLAVVDPVLTYSMPPEITAGTGLDALTQLMEAYISNKANPLTDGVCREGLWRAARSLQSAYEDGGDKAAREDMSLASLFSGLALANAKLGAVHGLAAPVGGIFPAPHGVICARLLPYVMETNVHLLQTRVSGSQSLARYDEVAKILTGTDTALAADGIAWMHDLCTQLKIPPLSKFGLKEEDFPTVVEKAQGASSMKGNPIRLTDEELVKILRKAI